MTDRPTAEISPVFFASLVDGTELTEIRAHREQRLVDGPEYARIAELLLRVGVRIIPSGRWYPSAAHADEDVDLGLAAAGRTLAELEP